MAEARKAGLEEAAIAALAAGAVPSFESGSRDEAIYRCATELLLQARLRVCLCTTYT